jgi:DNA helicase-2/ATP-dependent DNA helicase PcrA
MPSPENRAVIAVAGAAKTQFVIDEALVDPSRRVLITTFTNENLRQIQRRIEQQVGVVPDHIQLASWFTFLLRDGARPYQYCVLADIGVVRGLNFDAQRQRFAKKTERRYFLDRNGDVFRDGLADFMCTANTSSGGAVISRLEALYDDVYVDEVQDLVGYDLDVLDLLLASRIAVTVVGDPRQHTLSTSQAARNKKYRGAGIHDWLEERSGTCARQHRNRSLRCNQAICDFASALFPDLPAMHAASRPPAAHEGVHLVAPMSVHAYYEAHRPTVLRDRQTTDTFGLPAMNIGVSKGSTFEHVLIFPTKPMLGYLADGDASKLKAPERLYVAVTRARHSVAFVVPS